MASRPALRKMWRRLEVSIEGKNRNQLTESQWKRLHKVIENAGLGGSPDIEVEARLSYCLLKLHKLPDAAVEREIKEHLERAIALLAALKRPDLEFAPHQIQSILHLAAGDEVLARQSRAQMWTRLPNKHGNFRIQFDSQWNDVRAKAFKDFAVDGFELAKWLFSTRVEIRKEDMFSIGGYVTNHREFYAKVIDIKTDLEKKLAANLTKPENFVFRGDPGSGKSFLVEQLAAQLGLPRPVDCNLSGYPTIAQALSAIISRTEAALNSDGKALLFIDEADTSIGGINLFQGFIAAMNGEKFVHNGAESTFKKKNLIIFFAMSSEEKKWRADPNSAPQKWVDFTERVPASHWVEPPSINSSAGERVFRAIGLLNGMATQIKYADANALFYIGWNDWKSTRELELSLRKAVTNVGSGGDTLRLSDFRPSQAALEAIEQPSRTLLDELGAQGQDLWNFGKDRKIRITFAPPAAASP
jgi:hypothetical protein